MRQAATRRCFSTGSGGFSLIEVMVAASLLATAFMALTHLLALANRANADARESTYVTVLAAQKIEELRASPLPDTSPGGSIDYLDAAGSVVDGEASPGGARYRRQWAIEPLTAGLDAVAITVTVSRRAMASAGHVRLTTIRARVGP